MWTYNAVVRKVIDGDTVDLSIDLGFGVTVHERCRLVGIDAPEIVGVPRESTEFQRGIVAKRHLEQLVGVRFEDDTAGGRVVVRVVDGGAPRAGRYERWYVEIYSHDVNADGVGFSASFNAQLVAGGYVASKRTPISA